MLSLHSFLAEPIQRFIELHQISGSDYYSQGQLLGAFDRFAAEQVPPRPAQLSQALVQAYQARLAGLAPGTQANYWSVVCQLCRYLAARDPRVYVPEPLSPRRARVRRRPYIYPTEQIQALLGAAAALPPSDSLRPHTEQTLLGLLYCTGLRIGEAIALRLDDFQASQQRLFVAAGKFHKARWIALAPSVCQALSRYLERRLAFRPAPAQAPLFINLRGRALHHCTVIHDFHRLLDACGIARGGPTSPRLHDLRHTFAVHRLLAWYRQGEDLNARLPALATYLGHVNIASTRYYLQPTAELLGACAQRFHTLYREQVQPPGGDK
jgi:integrase